MIVFFTYDLATGGTEKVVVYLANYLAKQRKEVTLLTVSNNNELSEIINPNIRLVSLDKNKIIGSIPSLIKYLRQEKVDCFIANVWPLTVISTLVLMFKRKTNLILVEHCNLTEEFKGRSLIFKLLQSISIKFFYNLADNIITVSKGVKKDLLAKGVKGQKVSVIYNPLENPNKSSIDKRLIRINSWLSGEIKIISVGKLKKQKNFPNLINAIDFLHNKLGVDSRVLILGEGPERENIEVLVEEKKLTNKVFLPGQVADPVSYIKESDLFVLPSDFEGFGLVIAEALSEGKTVVSTDCKSGPSEILKEGNLGYLCKVNDFEDLALTIKKALDNPFDPKPLIRRSKDFSISNIGEQYKKIIG